MIFLQIVCSVTQCFNQTISFLKNILHKKFSTWSITVLLHDSVDMISKLHFIGTILLQETFAEQDCSCTYDFAMNGHKGRIVTRDGAPNTLTVDGMLVPNWWQTNGRRSHSDTFTFFPQSVIILETYNTDFIYFKRWKPCILKGIRNCIYHMTLANKWTDFTSWGPCCWLYVVHNEILTSELLLKQNRNHLT